MVDCSFCGKEIKKGTGLLFVKKDGKSFWYCSSKCDKNQNKLGRVPRRVAWTKTAQNEKKRATK